MTPRARHWAFAFTLVVAMHGVGLVCALQQDDQGAKGIGAGGLQMGLGMAGGASGSATAALAEASPVIVEEISEVTPVEVETVFAKTATTVNTALMIESVEVVSEESAETPAFEAVPEAVEVPVQRAEPIQTPEAQIVAVPSLATIESPRKPVAEEALQQDNAFTGEAPFANTSAEAKTTSVAGDAGKSGAAQSENTGNGSTASKGGRPGVQADYLTMLMAWLEKHKEYPARARRRRDEGTATLVFTIYRDGTVSGEQVRISTGSDILDEEVFRMLKRAQPLPPFPSDLPKKSMKLALPVQFELR